MGEGIASYLHVRYAADRRAYTSYPAQLTAHLAERHLPPPRGPAGERCRLLDLGCGRGEFLAGFRRLGYDGVGFDRCRIDGGPDVPVVVGDHEAGPLPFDDGSFDVVFNKSVLEHTAGISHLLGECQRVLRPGGLLLSMVPDWKAQFRHFYDDWTHVRPFTLEGLRECLECHGFDVDVAVRFRQLPFLWKRPWLRPVASVAARLPDGLKRRSKLVRFAKEWMLLAVARRPALDPSGLRKG